MLWNFLSLKISPIVLVIIYSETPSKLQEVRSILSQYILYSYEASKHIIALL